MDHQPKLPPAVTVTVMKGVRQFWNKCDVVVSSEFYGASFDKYQLDILFVKLQN